MALPVRAAQYWDTDESGWRLLPGDYAVDAAHSLADVRLTASLTVDA